MADSPPTHTNSVLHEIETWQPFVHLPNLFLDFLLDHETLTATLPLLPSTGLVRRAWGRAGVQTSQGWGWVCTCHSWGRFLRKEGACCRGPMHFLPSRAAPVPGQSRGLSRAGDMRAIGCPIQKGQGSRVVLTQPRGLRQEQTPTLRQTEAVGVRALCECQGAGWGHCP